MTRLRRAVLALLAALALPASAAARRVAVVAAADEPLRAAVTGALSKSAGDGVRVFTFQAEELADPIRKGELLARLVASDLVVPVGDAATALVLDEVEDVPVYFVGAAVVPGKRLASQKVSGILAYDPALLVAAVARLWPGRLGLAYTPGYEDVAAEVREAARARGLTLEERRIEKARDVPAGLDFLLGRCRAVFLTGDPLLARGAGFEFAAERSLARRVPLVGVDAWQVARGAFLGSEPRQEALGAAAATAVAGSDPAKLAGGRAAGAPDGRVLVNGALSRRWSVALPKDADWKVLSR